MQTTSRMCLSITRAKNEELDLANKTVGKAIPSYKNRQTPSCYQSSLSLQNVKIDSPVSPEDKAKFDERIEKLKKRMESLDKKDIFRISTAAATRLRHLIRNAPKGENCIKISVQRKGCSGYSYTMDYATCDMKPNVPPNDPKTSYHRIDKDGVIVLVDPQAVFFLSGTMLDFKASEVEERFVFENPNAKHYCGCGESFLV